MFPLVTGNLLHLCTIHIEKNVSVKEGNVLFNEALNTFYLRLDGWNEK